MRPERQSVEKEQPRIVFLTRDPVFREQSGSTTYISNLLTMLMHRGTSVTLVSTLAGSRSPRLCFRMRAPVPAGLKLRVPGYLRLGGMYWRLWQPKAWARALTRTAGRRAWLRSGARIVQRLWGDRLFAEAWDLTPPTTQEVALACAELQRTRPGALLANYCPWGEPMAQRAFGTIPSAILMHDLLSDRVRRFAEKGTPLDMPALSEAQELRWLAGADLVLAAQPREAERIRSRIAVEVIVSPVLLHPRALDPSAVVAGRCLFVGSNIDPNRDALGFLLEEVWPRVRGRCPSAVLAIAGTVGRAVDERYTVEERTQHGLEVLGLVPDLQLEYARAAVCVVPLRMGTGIKIKLLEALENGKAIVSTSVGIQGLEDWAHAALAVEDDAPRFAACVVELLQNDTERCRREELTLQLAQAHFGPDLPLPASFQSLFFGSKETPSAQARS